MFGSTTDGLLKKTPDGEPSSQQTVLSLFRPQTWKKTMVLQDAPSNIALLFFGVTWMLIKLATN